MKWQFLTVFIISFNLLLFAPLNAQGLSGNDSEDLIAWDHNIRLKWDDYRFRSFRNRNIKGEMAISGIRISVLGYMNEGIPEFTVRALFVKSDSWTTDSTNVELLKHEQLHFDIGELYAQKIREKMEELKGDRETLPKRYRSAINNLITLFKSYSAQYDYETSFGTDHEIQDKWIERIEGLLSQYK